MSRRNSRPSPLVGLPITCINKDTPSVLVLLFLTLETLSIASLRTKESLNGVLATNTQLQMVARHDLIVKISLLPLLLFLFHFQRINSGRVDVCSYSLSWAPSYMSLILGLTVLSYLISPFPDFFFFFKKDWMNWDCSTQMEKKRGNTLIFQHMKFLQKGDKLFILNIEIIMN